MITVVEGAIDVDLNDPMAVRAYLDSLHPLMTGTAGGDTACVEIQAENQIIILDAGTGIRALGQELMSGPCGRGEGIIHLFFSHTHWDHIQGLPFFLPAYVPGNLIRIYAVHDVEPALRMQMSPATFPVTMDDFQATLEFIPIKERETFVLKETQIQVSNLRLSHPGRAYAYRFEHQGNAFVYATDVECKRLDDANLQPLVNFFAGADAVIFDSQFSLRESLVRADWGHSSAVIGVDIARRAKVKRLILFHHDPTTTDAELIKILQETKMYQAKFEAEPVTEVLVGRESLTLNLIPPQPYTLTNISATNTAVLMVTEDFDQEAAQRVVQEFAQLPKLIVDLSDVKQLYIAGLRALIDLKSIWGGHPLALAAVSTQAKEIMELTNCLDLFSIYPTISTARDALEAQEVLRLPGQIVADRYRIEAKLRENEIGTVFKATDTRLDRWVSLLVLSPTFNPATAHRLLEQARKSARLNSTNIVTLFDAAEEQGLYYLVMEYVNAPTLQTLLGKKNPLSLLQFADQVAQALEYAHGQGVYHGNLEPDNILVNNRVKLTDFGLRVLQENMTVRDTAIFGNRLSYTAPEQIAGQAPDARSDLFSLGVILYQLATNKLPFEDGDYDQVPLSPRQLNPSLSSAWSEIIMTLLAKTPSYRYESAAHLREILALLEPAVAQSATTPSTDGPIKINREIPQDTKTAIPTPPEFISQQSGSLIGREQEMRRILKLWSLSKNGRGQFLLIGGETGIGKTRLIEEILARSQDAISLVAQCHELGEDAPYQQFMEIGRTYLTQTPPEILRKHFGTGQSSNLAAILAPLFPEIHTIFPNLELLPRLSPSQEELRLKNSLVQFLKGATHHQPWLLFFDDLHWSDPSSLQLLHYLAHNLSNLPIMLVGTYRDVELTEGHPLKELISTLSRVPVYHHLTLHRLNRTQIQELLTEIWDETIPDTWVSNIYNRTGGNPFYVKEIAQSLVEEGLVSYIDNCWHFADIVDIKLPDKIRDIVIRRINKVSPETQEVLNKAAILGHQFDFAELQAFTHCTEEKLLSHIDEAMQYNLIYETEGQTNLSFANLEIRHVIGENLSKLHHRRLHKLAGNTLEQLYGDKLNQVAGRVAHHYLMADDRQRACLFSIKAAKYAQFVYANETALHWYTQASQILPEEAPYPPEAIDLYQGLGDMLRTEARYSEATKAYEKMSHIAQMLDETVSQAKARYLLATTQIEQGEYDTALKLAERAEQTARAAKEEKLATRALYAQGWARLNLGQTQEALTVGEQILVTSQKTNAQSEIGYSLNLLAATHDVLGNYTKAVEYQQQALTLYRKMDDRGRIAVMLHNLGQTYTHLKNYQAALPLFHEALAMADEIGDRTLELMCLNNIGLVQIGLGSYREAEEQLLQVIQMPETVQTFILAVVHRNIAEALLGQNKLKQALTQAELALALSQDKKTPRDLGCAWRTLGLVLIEQSDSVVIGDKVYTIEDCFAESLNIFSKSNMSGEHAETLRLWAKYEEERGDQDTARQLRQTVIHNDNALETNILP